MTAFQADAFQNDAFQIGKDAGGAPPTAAVGWNPLLAGQRNRAVLYVAILSVLVLVI